MCLRRVRLSVCPRGFHHHTTCIALPLIQVAAFVAAFVAMEAVVAVEPVVAAVEPVAVAVVAAVEPALLRFLSACRL